MSSYALEVSKAWLAFCKVKGLSGFSMGSDELVGKAFIAGYMAGVGGLGL